MQDVFKFGVCLWVCLFQLSGLIKQYVQKVPKNYHVLNEWPLTQKNAIFLKTKQKNSITIDQGN